MRCFNSSRIPVICRKKIETFEVMNAEVYVKGVSHAKENVFFLFVVDVAHNLYLYCLLFARIERFVHCRNRFNKVLDFYNRMHYLVYFFVTKRLRYVISYGILFTEIGSFLNTQRAFFQ